MDVLLELRALPFRLYYAWLGIAFYLILIGGVAKAVVGWREERAKERERDARARAQAEESRRVREEIQRRLAAREKARPEDR